MYRFPSYLLKPISGQDLLPQEERYCKLTVHMEAYLLACARQQLCAFNKDTDGFQGEYVAVFLLLLCRFADALLCQVVADTV
jgi:hypothetical protein